jgi:hypothetical protein
VVRDVFHIKAEYFDQQFFTSIAFAPAACADKENHDDAINQRAPSPRRQALPKPVSPPKQAEEGKAEEAAAREEAFRTAAGTLRGRVRELEHELARAREERDYMAEVLPLPLLPTLL